jgi:hypothetical protein
MAIKFFRILNIYINIFLKFAHMLKKSRNATPAFQKSKVTPTQ